MTGGPAVTVGALGCADQVTPGRARGMMDASARAGAPRFTSAKACEDHRTATLTLRLHDAQHDSLKRLAAARGVSAAALVESLITRALTEFDTETRFLARAARGAPADGLALLDRLDAGGQG